ncbi:MAG: helix-turn-helix domain-containing protein [Chloroflexota bacterium]|nr:helix-turn-helix domain-containing protein [Chloroflexota bacterium]
MSDHPLGQAADQATDQATTHTITDAARLLGVSENAVRKRIRRGTLPAHKQGDRWLVALPGQVADHPSATTDQAAPTSGLAGGQVAPTTGQASDLAAAITPLADLIERLTMENRELAEAATTWQMRAGILEQQLKQLTAGGDTPTDAPVAAPFAPGEAQPANAASDTAPPWWRFWERWG